MLRLRMTMKLWQWQNPTSHLDNCHFRLLSVRSEAFLILLNSYSGPVLKGWVCIQGRVSRLSAGRVLLNDLFGLMQLSFYPSQAHTWVSVLWGSWACCPCSLCTQMAGQGWGCIPKHLCGAQAAGDTRVCWLQNAFDKKIENVNVL